MPSLGDFFHTQFILDIPKPSASFASQTVVITGANGGLGKEIAKHVIHLGASKVIFGCRSLSRGKEAKAEVEGLLKCAPDLIEVWQLDLESVSSIKSFVDQANALPRLDTLVANAGIGNVPFKVVYDTERTLAVNDIGTFLLALQLMPKLRKTAGQFGTTPHLTVVTSALYDVAKYPEYPEQQGEDIFTWFKDESHFNKMNQ
jgi:retinol dehydrogenase 12